MRSIFSFVLALGSFVSVDAVNDIVQIDLLYNELVEIPEDGIYRDWPSSKLGALARLDHSKVFFVGTTKFLTSESSTERVQIAYLLRIIVASFYGYDLELEKWINSDEFDTFLFELERRGDLDANADIQQRVEAIRDWNSWFIELSTHE